MSGTRHGNRAGAAGWEGLLDDGERLVWHGAPDRRAGLGGRIALTAISGFALGIYGLVLLLGGESGAFDLVIGVILVAVGIVQIYGLVGLLRHGRGAALYALTDRRALILPRGFGGPVVSHGIEPSTRIELRGGRTPAVLFADEEHRSDDGSWTTRTGFEALPEAAEVHRKMLEVQQARSPAAEASSR